MTLVKDPLCGEQTPYEVFGIGTEARHDNIMRALKENLRRAGIQKAQSENRRLRVAEERAEGADKINSVVDDLELALAILNRIKRKSSDVQALLMSVLLNQIPILRDEAVASMMNRTFDAAKAFLKRAPEGELTGATRALSVLQRVHRILQKHLTPTIQSFASYSATMVMKVEDE